MANELEVRALKLSSIGCLFMAALGFYYAWQTSSEAILLDGIFSLVNFAMAILTLKVARKASQPPTGDFQFGLGQLEPMLNSFKGFIFLGVILMAIFTAINSLASGGRSMVFGPAIHYAAIALFGCVILAFTLRYYAKKTNSNLLVVETQGWFVDSALSGAVLITFIIGSRIETTQYSGLMPYLDPAMVLFMCVLMLPVPVTILKDNLFGLLLISPEQKIQRQLDELLTKLLLPYQVAEFKTRYIKSNRFIYAHVFIQANDMQPATLDKLRHDYLATAKQQNISVNIVIEVSSMELQAMKVTSFS